MICVSRALNEVERGKKNGVRGETTFVGFGQSSTLLMEAHTRRKKKGGETMSMYLFMVSLLDIVSCWRCGWFTMRTCCRIQEDAAFGRATWAKSRELSEQGKHGQHHGEGPRGLRLPCGSELLLRRPGKPDVPVPREGI